MCRFAQTAEAGACCEPLPFACRVTTPAVCSDLAHNISMAVAVAFVGYYGTEVAAPSLVAPSLAALPALSHTTPICATTRE